MALIHSQIFGPIHGKIGGSIFQRGKSGTVVKALVNPNNPRSADQEEHRSYYAELKNIWNSFNYNEREHWRQEAYIHGNNLNGYQYFLKTMLSFPQAQYGMFFRNGILNRNTLLNLGTLSPTLIPFTDTSKYIVVRTVITKPVGLICNYQCSGVVQISQTKVAPTPGNFGNFRSFPASLSTQSLADQSMSFQVESPVLSMSVATNKNVFVFPTASITDTVNGNITGNGTTATFTCNFGLRHGLSTGMTIVISNAPAYNGSYVITVLGPDRFTFAHASTATNNLAISTSISNDLSYQIWYDLYNI